MHDLAPLIVGVTIFLSSLVSLRIAIPVAIIEIVFGAVLGNTIGFEAQEWMMYFASLGGILLTFLAGAEIDMELMKKKFVASFAIGTLSFLIPFIGVSLFTYYVVHWTLYASLIAGVALSTTSVAIVYSVLLESGFSKSEMGKVMMAATFFTDIETTLVLTLLFTKPTLYTGLFIVASVIVIALATKFSHIVFDNPVLKNKVIEPEIKYIFVLLVTFMFFAELGNAHAVLPSFILGLFMAKHFVETSETKEVLERLRTVSYAIVTPVFFIVGGLRVSFSAIMAGFGLFAVFFLLKFIFKSVGVYFLAQKYIPGSGVYMSLIMSTGLTFGTIASVFGLTSGLINKTQYSVLLGAVIASAVIPTFIAQKWFIPWKLIGDNKEGVSNS